MTVDDPLVVDLHQLQSVARKEIPNAARFYVDAATHVHNSSYHDAHAFEGMPLHYVNWVVLRNRLQEVLGDMATNLYEVSAALEATVTEIADTDKRNAKKLLAQEAKTYNLPPALDLDDPEQAPPPKRPGDPVDTVTASLPIPIGPVSEIEVPEEPKEPSR